MKHELTDVLHQELGRPDLIALILEQYDENDLCVAYVRSVERFLEDSGLAAMMNLVFEDDLRRAETGQEPLPDLGIGLPSDASAEIVSSWIDSLVTSVAS